MKTFRLLVLLAALIFAGVAMPSRVRAQGQDDAVSFDFFYDSLAPYGEWIQVGDYGLCWRPTNVDQDWSPYSDGYWAYTDAGWTWVSYEEFGGIVYHYGRWLHLDDDSWCWTPGYDWAPAWVSWRSNDDYVGWAPLPPEAHWAPDTGISVWVDSTCDIGPGYYHFCHVRDFGAPVLRGVLCRRSDNIVIFRSTLNVTNICYDTAYYGGPVIFNGGPSFDIISREVVRPIPTLKLVQNARFDAAHWRDHRGPGGRLAFNAQTVGNELIVAAPRVLRPTDPAAFRSRAKRMLAGDSVTKGWDMVKDPQMRQQLHAEIGRQAKGLTPQTAPARRVTAAELKVVPSKGDPNAPTPTAERRERSGNGQPGNAPTSRSAEVAPSNPGNRSETQFRDHSHPQNFPPTTAAPGANGLLKPFNPNAETRVQPGPQSGQSTPNGRERSEEAQQQQRAAEAGRNRAEEERAAQQRRAEMPNQRPQEEAPRDQAEQQRQQQLRQEQRDQQQQRGQQQQQQQREQMQREQSQQREQQQQRGQQQQQQREQMQQREQQQRDQQQQAERNNDARRAQEAERDRDRQRQQESQRNSQTEQHQSPSQGNSPQHQGGGRSSKDGKDKDKDKNGN